MPLSDLTNLLSAASVPSSAVAAVADLLLETERIFAPSITEGIIHKYDNDFQERISEAVAIINGSGDDHAAAVGQFFYQLLLDAGTPVARGVSEEPLIGVRVPVVLAFAVLAAKVIRDERVITDLQHQAVTPKNP